MEYDEDKYKLILEEENKYVYYLLAISAACIAYSVEKTIGKCAEWTWIFILAAVGCWFWSFCEGCRNRVYNIKKLRNELGRERVKKMIDSSAKEETKNNLENKYQDICKKTHEYFLRQSWLLVIGVCFFIVWHVIVNIHWFCGKTRF